MNEEWAGAVADAARLEAAHPEWTARPVRSRGGVRIEAWRDPGTEGLCAAVGTAGEVRAALERVPQI
jgi:hypothetical protein